MTLIERITKLFDDNFPLQLDGRPRAVSEWGIVYETFSFVVWRPTEFDDPGQRVTQEIARFVEEAAILAATQAWLLEKKDREGPILVWRIRPTTSENGDFATATKQVKVRLRAHFLTQEAYDKGPILGDDEPVTPEQAERTNALWRQMQEAKSRSTS